MRPGTASPRGAEREPAGAPAGDVPVAVGGAAGEVVAVARLLQLAAAEALAEDGALVLGDGALDLQQELVVGVVRDRALQEHHFGAGAAELLQEQDLVGVLARQPVRGQHGDDPDGAVAHGVAQRVQAGSVEPAAAVALVAEDVLVGEGVAVVGDPGAQGGELAVDGLLALLALGRDAGIKGGAHGGLTSGCGVGGGGGSGSSSKRREAWSSRSAASRGRTGTEWMTQLAARAGGRFGIGRVLRGRKPGRLHHAQAQGKCASRRRGALIRPAPANGTATVSRTASIAFGSCTCCGRASPSSPTRTARRSPRR